MIVIHYQVVSSLLEAWQCFLYACVLKHYEVLDDWWSFGSVTGLFSLKLHIIGSWSFFFCYFLSSVFCLSEMLLRRVWPLFVNLYCLLIKTAISILLYCLCFPWLVPLVLFFFSPTKIFTSWLLNLRLQIFHGSLSDLPEVLCEYSFY